MPLQTWPAAVVAVRAGGSAAGPRKIGVNIHQLPTGSPA